MHPFWAVTRLTADELSKRNFLAKSNHQFNVKLTNKQFNVVTVGALAGHAVSLTTAVTVPIMTNTSAVALGAELFMEVAPRASVAANKRKTWKDDIALTAMSRAKAAKAAAMAKPKAAPCLTVSEV